MQPLFKSKKIRSSFSAYSIFIYEKKTNRPVRMLFCFKTPHICDGFFYQRLTKKVMKTFRIFSAATPIEYTLGYSSTTLRSAFVCCALAVVSGNFCVLSSLNPFPSILPGGCELTDEILVKNFVCFQQNYCDSNRRRE